MVEQKPSTRWQGKALYYPADFYLVRAPALPAQIFAELANAGQVYGQTELDGALQKAEQACAAMLLQLTAQPEVRLALALASPSLLEGLERVLHGEEKQARTARVSAGLLRYLVRMCTRPTPFGAFAGVGWGYFADRTDLCLGETALARFRTRPDMHWLLKLLRRLEADPTLVAQLQVRLNQTAYLAGERARLPFADTYGHEDTRAISLRATAVVRKVFALAQDFIPYTELQAAVQQAFPRATSEQVERVLRQLWGHGFLISSLHPPLTDARPAHYVRDLLGTLDGVQEIKDHLTRILDEATALDGAGLGAPVGMVSTLVQDQERLVPTENKEAPGDGTSALPLQVDSALQVNAPLLHRTIGQVAAHAATFLLSQTALPKGSSHLQDYRLLFLDTYGEQAEVPLLDLLSPENGLDAPDGYQHPAPTYHRLSAHAPQEIGPRDQVLLQLLSEALSQGSLEVELTEEIQRRLERWPPQREEAPLSLEIYLQIHAASRSAIDRGEWIAVLGSNCGSQSAGRTFGRFFDLLGEPGMKALHELVAHEEALLPDVIFAELSYQPWQARAANVATRPPLRAYEIAIGTTSSVPPERVLTLSDLAVGVQNGRFYVRSMRLGKQVRVCQSHMLNASLAPNVCRFLLEIANDGLPTLSAFDWGVLASAPCLPRLFLTAEPSARLVISPARWHLRAETISPLGEGVEETRWFRGLRTFRKQWQVPRYVYLTWGDNRLLLDLENPLMGSQLRAELKKLKNDAHITLEELLPDFEHLWLRDAQDAGYFSEIVVPLLRAAAPDPTAKPAPRHSAGTPSNPPIPVASRKRFPGEEWVYLKLYAAFSQHEELLAGPIREVMHLLQEQELIDRWFFVRYADPEPHLRLRFHVRGAVEASAVLALVLPWSTQLARRAQLRRVALDTYEREVERYGGPDAIDLSEQVFTVDSALTSNIIAAQYARHLTLDPLAVAVFTLDSLFSALGCDLQQRVEWTHQASDKYVWSKAFRPERRRYCDLLSPRGELDPDQASQRALLLDLVRPHKAVLGELSAQIHQLIEAEHLWVSETSLLGSLAHVHVNRLLGIDRNREKQVYAFWRHTLDALHRRPDLLLPTSTGNVEHSERLNAMRPQSIEPQG
jgi:thiopeptide-type bacteriocin biosynthesis protein